MGEVIHVLAHSYIELAALFAAMFFGRLSVKDGSTFETAIVAIALGIVWPWCVYRSIHENWPRAPIQEGDGR